MSGEFNIREELKKLPDSPGVYMHKDRFGQIIYIGKAVSLKSRVRQYFNSPKSQPLKVRKMVEQIAEFEYMTTINEMEALILECNLIKEHMPKYNVLLRDDKTFPYIKVTLGEDYPRILKTRRITNDGSRYFGPYADAGAVNTIIDMLNSVYSFKRCSYTKFPSGHSPCLNYHIGQCRGVCLGNVSKEEYAAYVEKAMDFLHGRNREILSDLKAKIESASEDMAFEEAARLRDLMDAVHAITEKQRVVLSSPSDIDVILISQGLSGAHAVLFAVRGGKLTGRDAFFLGTDVTSEKGELVSEFIKQYYGGNFLIPKEILLKDMPEDSELLCEWLSTQKGSPVNITLPQRGEKRDLLEFASRDIEKLVSSLDDKIFRQMKKFEEIRSGLDKIFEFAAKRGRPVRRIEAYDISNTGGEDSVGGMVVFSDGRPVRKDYRRFRIKTIEGQDDIASLQEMLFRRFSHWEKGTPGFDKLPDAIFMDGGKGQVSGALDVAMALDIDVAVVGMVKDDKHRTKSLLYAGEEYILKDFPGLYAYVGTIQEEVHRFASEYHRKLRGKKLSRSVLDDIRGIGEKRKAALLSHFGSIEAIKEASREELTSVRGMNRSAADAVYEHFHGSEVEADGRK